MTDKPTRLRAGAVARAAGAAACAVAFVAAVLSPIVATIAMVVPTPAPAGAQTRQTGPGLLRLVEQSSFVAPAGTFVLQTQVSSAPSDAELRIEVHDRVTTRSGFVRSLQGDGLRRRLLRVGPQPLSSFIPAGGTTARLSLQLGNGPGQLPATAEGVYPVVVDLLDGGTQLSRLITHLVLLPGATDEEFAPLAVSVIVPVGGPPSVGVDGSIDVSDNTRNRIVAATQPLLTHADVPATLVPTPETVEGLAASNDPDAAGVLGGLGQAATATAADRQVLSGPYVRLDLPAWLEEDLAGELNDQFARGANALSDRLTRPDGRTWVADSGLDSETVTWLRGRGVDQLVVPEGDLTPLDDGDFPTTLTRPFAIDGTPGVRAVMADQGLAAHVDATGDPLLDAHRLLADLAVLYFDRPPLQRAAVVAIPDDWQPSAPFLDTLLAGLDSAGILLPVTLDELFADTPTAGQGGLDTGDEVLVRTLVPTETPTLGSFGDDLLAARADLATYRAAVGPASPRPDPLDARILVAGAADLSSRERRTYLTGVRETIAAELGKVAMPERQTITLTAREGQVPLTFHNDAGYPIAVEVELQADKLDFPAFADHRLRLDLNEETTRVDLEVTALASGTSPLYVVVRTPDRRIELGRTRYTVRSTAFSGVGLVLSIGAGGFLVLWWARSIRRTVAARRHAPHHRPESG